MTRRQASGVLTNKVPEARAKFDLGLDKGVSVRVEGHKENLFHLVSELTKAGQGRGRDRREHLGAQQLEDFLGKTSA